MTSGEWEVLARHGSKVSQSTARLYVNYNHEQDHHKVLCQVCGYSVKSPFSPCSDLGERVVEVGVLPGHQRHPSGASPLCGQLRFSWRRGQINKTRLLS